MKDEWLRREVQAFAPYVVAPIHESRVINANENYFNVLSVPAIWDEVQDVLRTFRPQVYPDPMANRLREALADYVCVRPAEVLAGNGGDEMISCTMQTFLNGGDQVLLHVPTFDMYEVGASLLGADILKVEDAPLGQRDQAGILAAIRAHQPKLTFLCNPNNPTGELLPLSFVEACLEAADNLVFVDEAYLEFAGAESAVGLIRRFPNLIVLRTLSKAFGLAGLRCGYLVADEGIIRAVAAVKSPYNLNSLTQAIAEAVVRHRGEVLSVRDIIVAERDRVYGALKGIPGLVVYPSRTNFLLVQAGDAADRLFDAWRRADILVKRYTGNPLLPGAFRITVTTRDTDDAVVQAAEEVMGHASG